MSLPGGADATADAELDRLAEEALAADVEDAQLDSLAAELLQEGNGTGPAAVPANGSTTNTTPVQPVRPPGVGGGAAASGMAAFNSLMSRARGMRFSSAAGMPNMPGMPGATTGNVPDPYSVLGVRDSVIWRQVLANDTAVPPIGPRALSRSYLCQKNRVSPLNPQTLAKQATREAATAIKAAPQEVEKLDQFANDMQAAFQAEIERALAARLATDPDFDIQRFPAAAKRFAL